MTDMILGKNFWTMFSRFLVIPAFIWMVPLPTNMSFESQAHAPVTEEPIWFLAYYMIGFSWFGWGFAFWRFGPDKAPTRYFAVYPLVTGLICVPVLLWLASLNAELSTNELLAVVVFSVIAGPLMALAIVSACRYLPNFTSLM